MILKTEKQKKKIVKEKKRNSLLWQISHLRTQLIRVVKEFSGWQHIIIRNAGVKLHHGTLSIRDMVNLPPPNIFTSTEESLLSLSFILILFRVFFHIFDIVPLFDVLIGRGHFRHWFVDNFTFLTTYRLCRFRGCRTGAFC